jgi:hypothetical protein
VNHADAEEYIRTPAYNQEPDSYKFHRIHNGRPFSDQQFLFALWQHFLASCFFYEDYLSFKKNYVKHQNHKAEKDYESYPPCNNLSSDTG